MIEDVVRITNPTGNISLIGVYFPEDPGGVDETRNKAASTVSLGEAWTRGINPHRSAPVKRYNEYLRSAIASGRRSAQHDREPPAATRSRARPTPTTSSIVARTATRRSSSSPTCTPPEAPIEFDDAINQGISKMRSETSPVRELPQPTMRGVGPMTVWRVVMPPSGVARVRNEPASTAHESSASERGVFHPTGPRRSPPAPSIRNGHGRESPRCRSRTHCEESPPRREAANVPARTGPRDGDARSNSTKKRND